MGPHAPEPPRSTRVPPPRLPPYRRGLGGPQGRPRPPGQGDRHGGAWTSSTPAAARGNFAVPVARARPPGHRGRPQPQRPVRPGAPRRRGRGRRPGPGRPGRRPRPLRRRRARRLRRGAVPRRPGVRGRPRRGRAQRRRRAAPRAAPSACSPPGSAAPCSPGPSPATSRRPGRRSATRTAAGARATRCPAASPPSSSPRWSAARACAVGAVHGVRVFADLVPGGLVDTEPGALEALTRLETAAASRSLHSVHSRTAFPPCRTVCLDHTAVNS